MKPRLTLHCDCSLSSFSLTLEGESWRRQFSDLKHALDYAAAVITEDLPLVVYNETGRVIIESFLSPAAQEWR